MTQEQTPKAEPRPSSGMTLALALQHVLILFGGITLVPTLLGKMYDISFAEMHRVTFATAMIAAIAIVLQIVRRGRFGLGRTMFIGTSGAFLTCSHSALEMGGFALLATMGLCAVPFQFLYSFFFRFWKNIITPVVGGVIIMLAMTGMLKDALAVWTDSQHGSDHSLEKLCIGAFTILVLLCVELYGGKKWRPWAIAIGTVVGCLAAAPFGMFDASLVHQVPWLGFPGFDVVRLGFPITPEHISLFLSFVVASLVTCVKYTGDAIALQQVADTTQRKIDYDAIQGGLYASATGSALSCLSGGMPLTSHSPNISLVMITGTAAKRIGYAASGCLLLLSFCPKVLAFLLSLPGPVVGAVAVTLVAHLFSTGMLLAISEGLNFKKGIMVGFPLCAGIALSSHQFLPDAFPPYLAPLMHNGFAVGSIVAVCLSVMMRYVPGKHAHIKIPLTDKGQTRMQDWLAKTGERMGLEQRRQFQLELSCDEVFLHMQREFAQMDEDATKPVTVKLFHDDARLVVELVVGATVTEVEGGTTPPSPEQADPAELDQLGLFLLGKTAKDVTHVHISGYAYVNFAIPVG